MHLLTVIRRSLRAALSAGRALVAAASRRSFQLLVALFRAADAGSAVRITYRKECGAISERIVEPGEPYPTEAGHIVFRGHDHSRGEDRTFRIDRITHYRTEEATVSRPADANRPSESLRYERDLIAHVIETGVVRPEVAASMGHRAEQIDTELTNRTAA